MRGGMPVINQEEGLLFLLFFIVLSLIKFNLSN